MMVACNACSIRSSRLSARVVIGNVSARAGGTSTLRRHGRAVVAVAVRADVAY